MSSNDKVFAVIVGVGMGLSRSLALKWAKEGFNLVLVSRSGTNAALIKEEIGKLYKNSVVECLNVDTSDETSVSTGYKKLLESKGKELGKCTVLLYNAGPKMQRRSVLETDIDQFNKQLQVGVTGALIWAQQLLPAMLEGVDDEKEEARTKRGTMIFTGATAALRGSALFQELAAPKFALRALTQSMAREFQKKGIHVAHIIVDGPMWQPKYGTPEFQQEMEKKGRKMTKDMCMDPEDLAETWWSLYAQKRSAWTQELDVRSYVEKF